MMKQLTDENIGNSVLSSNFLQHILQLRPFWTWKRQNHQNFCKCFRPISWGRDVLPKETKQDKKEQMVLESHQILTREKITKKIAT